MYSQAHVRAALKELTTEQLQRGMKAFSHPPRNSRFPYDGDSAGCFLYEARNGLRAYQALRASRTVLSFAYEGYGIESYKGYWASTDPQNCQDRLANSRWFYGECIRELAERGVTVEAVPEVAAL